MHKGAVVGGDMLLHPMVVGGIGADNFIGHINLGKLIGRVPAGVDNDARHAIQGECDEATERAADDKVYLVLTDVVRVSPGGPSQSRPACR